MLNRNEIVAIGLTTLILSFALSLGVGTQDYFLKIIYLFAVVFLVILVNITAKKVASYVLDSEIEVKIWELQRFGYKPHQKFKKPMPLGAILPIIFSIISQGLFSWMAVLTFDVKGKVYRAAKRHGLYSFTEMTESHIGLIAAAGIISNLVFAVIGYMIGFTEFSRLCLYFAAFNMIPISNLDGNKIFFGNFLLWIILTIITLIGVLIGLLIV